MDVDFADRKGVSQILEIIGGGKKTERIAEGMYTCGHWNFGDTIAAAVEDFPELPNGLSSYGVCDSPDQWRETFAAIIADQGRRFVVSFVEVKKADQSATGGWRWHKWGEYIGAQKPTSEYLYDEPTIERVYTFNVHELV